MFKSYKYTLLPTPEQQAKLQNFFGSCRFVYNLGLETKKTAWDIGKKKLSYFDLCSQLKELRDTDAAWLQDTPVQSLRVSLRNLENAYKQFFKGKGFPKFKNKNSKQSIQFEQRVAVTFKDNTIRLPNIGNVNCIFHRQFEGKIKSATVYKTPTGKYFVRILVDNQASLPTKKPISVETTVGVDMGIKTFATLSNGSSFENIKTLRNNLKRLRIEQRTLDRRFKKGVKEQSKNYYKQKLIVAKIYEHIANKREDYLHKVSTHLINSYDTICIEDLNIKGLLQNKNLSLSIGDIGWSKFEKMLNYKAEWYGKNIIYIGRFEPSSKTCSACGNVNSDLKLNNREWICSNCNSTHDRDVNAALNIKTFGLRDKPVSVNASH